MSRLLSHLQRYARHANSVQYQRTFNIRVKKWKPTIQAAQAYITVTSSQYFKRNPSVIITAYNWKLCRERMSVGGYFSTSSSLLYSSKSVEDVMKCIETEISEIKGKMIETLRLWIVRLLDMGLDKHQISAVICKSPDMLKTSHQKINDCTMFLFNLVFKPHEVYRILTLAPDIVNTEISQLDNNIKLLRKLGIQDGTLQKTIASCPTILIVKTKQFKLILKTLKERCQFSKEQVCKIIQTCPTVVHEDAYKMEVKFQYVYFTMGIQDPKSQVIARVFKHNLFHIRKRHEFLERMGLYERPDKKGMTQIENPSLKQIIDTTNERFAVKIAKSSVEDFQAFSNVFVNEVYHADRNSDYDSDDYDSDIYNNVYDNTNI